MCSRCRRRRPAGHRSRRRRQARHRPVRTSPRRQPGIPEQQAPRPGRDGGRASGGARSGRDQLAAVRRSHPPLMGRSAPGASAMASILAPARAADGGRQVSYMMRSTRYSGSQKRHSNAQYGTKLGPLCYAFLTKRRFPLLLAGSCALLWRGSRPRRAAEGVANVSEDNHLAPPGSTLLNIGRPDRPAGPESLPVPCGPCRLRVSPRRQSHPGAGSWPPRSSCGSCAPRAGERAPGSPPPRQSRWWPWRPAGSSPEPRPRPPGRG